MVSTSEKWMSRLFRLFFRSLGIIGATIVGGYQTAYAQDAVPAIYFNPKLERQQKLTVNRFLDFLEKNNIDSARGAIDSQFTKREKNTNKLLSEYAIELGKYFPTTTRSVVIVFPMKGFNTYRCRYYNDEGIFFHIDLYLKDNEVNGLIHKIDYKNSKELKKDRAFRKANQGKVEPDPIGPPPPPKPNLKPKRS